MRVFAFGFIVCVVCTVRVYRVFKGVSPAPLHRHTIFTCTPVRNLHRNLQFPVTCWWQINMWAHHPNITTPLHYDLLHNFYVQVYGRKRFVLTAPQAWRDAYLFPRIHPTSRMSQVPWTDPARFDVGCLLA